MSKLRGGLSGCSPASLDLLHRCRRHDACEIVAIHDPDPKRLADFRASSGIGLATGSFEQLLGSGVDFVVLAGDPGERLPQVQAAAAQGAHCLAVTPFADDVDTAAAMVSACERAGVRLGVYVDELQDPVVEQLRRMLAADWLGGIVALQGLLGDDAALRGAQPTRHPFFELVSRQVHLASWLTGREALRVTAQTTRSFSRTDDGAVATAVLRGNIPCTFAASRATTVRAFAVHGTDGGIRIAGDRLWLLGRQEFRGDVFDYLAPGHELALSRADLSEAIATIAPRVELLGRFARWLDDCDDYPCPGESALADLKVVAAMLRAARSGSAEDVAPSS